MYEISVQQSRSYMNDTENRLHWKLDEITKVEIPPNFFSQIGYYKQCARCVNLHIYPSGLNFTLFVTKESYDSSLEIADKINNFIRNDKEKELFIHLYLPEDVGGGDQIIAIYKI
jgi:hypothetical protein